MKSEQDIRKLLEEKENEALHGEHDFDGERELEGYINALRTVLEVPDYCKTCNHHIGNHTMFGLGKCLICESEHNKCEGFKRE